MTPAGMDISAHRGYIEAALRHAGGTHLYEDVQRLVASGDLQYWPFSTGLLLTQLVQYPQMKVCNVFLAAGNARDGGEMLKWVEQWALSVGCAKLEATGRMGWIRHKIPKALGWKVRMVYMEKRLG